ncbi:MAG TPA: selenium cofactor biosynthesis protein YqeC, partial [Atribacterota bacterium]|nr:selenium cofactor biosynthesis protein YqeC [Atribacterota bacterium]
MLISDALQLKERAFLSLVGAGGKTSLLQIIAQELVGKKKKVIVTTTTRMFTRQASPLLGAGQIIESTNARSMEDGIKDYFGVKRDNGIAILFKDRFLEVGGEKFSGPEPYYLNKWWQEGLADFFIVEADGAKGRPIKAPSQHEPVVASMTTDVV